eukprot:3294739-Amphidinium_carterae.1
MAKLRANSKHALGNGASLRRSAPLELMAHGGPAADPQVSADLSTVTHWHRRILAGKVEWPLEARLWNDALKPVYVPCPSAGNSPSIGQTCYKQQHVHVVLPHEGPEDETPPAKPGVAAERSGPIRPDGVHAMLHDQSRFMSFERVYRQARLTALFVPVATKKFIFPYFRRQECRRLKRQDAVEDEAQHPEAEPQDMHPVVEPQGIG